MINEDEREARLLARQIELLEKASPECWHCIADNHNWGERLDILYWIVSQPKCDKATALSVFWLGEPTGYDFEECQQKMGEDPYAVEPLLKYIVQRFNTTGYPRSEIAFDMLESQGCNLPELTPMVTAGKYSDFEELTQRQKNLGDASVKVRSDMMVLSYPGTDIGDFDDVWDFYYAFPVGIDCDTGEFVYNERPKDGQAKGNPCPSQGLPDQVAPASVAWGAPDADAAASSQIRAMRQKMQLESSASKSEPSSMPYASQGQAKAKASFLSIEREDIWFVFHAMTLGYFLVALLAFTSDKFYTLTGWIAVLVLICWEAWNGFSSFRSLQDNIALQRIFRAFAVGLLAGVFISLPGLACILLLKQKFGLIGAALIALVVALPLQWMIAAIFGKAYLKPAQ